EIHGSLVASLLNNGKRDGLHERTKPAKMLCSPPDVPAALENCSHSRVEIFFSEIVVINSEKPLRSHVTDESAQGAAQVHWACLPMKLTEATAELISEVFNYALAANPVRSRHI